MGERGLKLSGYKVVTVVTNGDSLHTYIHTCFFHGVQGREAACGHCEVLAEESTGGSS